MQVNEKWSRYKKPGRIKKLESIFVSSRGEFVAVASGNHITMLRKDDDYQGTPARCGWIYGDKISAHNCFNWFDQYRRVKSQKVSRNAVAESRGKGVIGND